MSPQQSTISDLYLRVISGLDPAGPEYEDFDIMAGLNPTSAEFVDVIHTDGKSIIFHYGTMRQMGHVDHYPNGAETQPGCIVYASNDVENGKNII